MMLLKTVNEFIALDLGTQAIALRIAQVKADEDREKIEALEAQVAELSAPPVDTEAPDGASAEAAPIDPHAMYASARRYAAPIDNSAPEMTPRPDIA